MNAKIIKSIALIFLMAIIAINVTIISTKNNTVTLNMKCLEAQAICYSGEGLSGNIILMQNELCYYEDLGNLGNGHFVQGCVDADSTCTL
jgi:hypothetical protein